MTINLTGGRCSRSIPFANLELGVHGRIDCGWLASSALSGREGLIGSSSQGVVLGCQSGSSFLAADRVPPRRSLGESGSVAAESPSPARIPTSPLKNCSVELASGLGSGFTIQRRVGAAGQRGAVMETRGGRLGAG